MGSKDSWLDSYHWSWSFFSDIGAIELISTNRITSDWASLNKHVFFCLIIDSLFHLKVCMWIRYVRTSKQNIKEILFNFSPAWFHVNTQCFLQNLFIHINSLFCILRKIGWVFLLHSTLDCLCLLCRQCTFISSCARLDVQFSYILQLHFCWPTFSGSSLPRGKYGLIEFSSFLSTENTTLCIALQCCIHSFVT